MARIETTHLVDDLNGGEAAETVEFTVGKVAYEIDLSAANADAFRRAVEPFVAASRRASTRTASASRRPSAGTDRAFNQDVRTWARGQGITIAERGRIPASVLAAYEAGHGSGPRAVAS